MDSLRSDVQEVFWQVFGDDDLIVTDATTADEIDDWDSMMHINLIIALEKRFGVKFAAAEISALKGKDQNVGSLIKLLEQKLARARAT